MSCDDGCTCRKTAKGQEMLLRYAREGASMVSDPEIQKIFAQIREDSPRLHELPDDRMLVAVMRVLARANRGDADA